MKYQSTKHVAVQNAINTKNLYGTINHQFSYTFIKSIHTRCTKSGVLLQGLQGTSS